MKRHSIPTMRSFTAGLIRAVFIGLTLAALVGGGSAQAQNYYWTNTANSSWSVAGSWSNGVPAAGGGTNNIINFNRAGTFASTNNLAGAFFLNQLNFGGPTVTLLGSNLTFIANGIIPPTLSQNSSATVTIQNGITLSNTTTVGGTGTGSVSLGGNINGDGGLVHNGLGLLTLTGSNSYAGSTAVTGGGTLRATGANSLTSGNLLLNNGVYEVVGGGTFTRGIGTGTNQVQLTGGNSGFSAVGGSLMVNLGGSGGTLTWGSATFNPDIFVLNASTADSALTLANNINLGVSGDRIIGVMATPLPRPLLSRVASAAASSAA